MELLGKMGDAVSDMPFYVTITAKSPIVLVFFAIYHPKLKVATARAGNTLVPCADRLEKLQEILGVKEDPIWHPHVDDGSIWPKGVRGLSSATERVN